MSSSFPNGYTSPPQNRFRDRDHSPTKSSPLRHTLSTRSQASDTDSSSIPSRQGTLSSNASSARSAGAYSGYDSASDPFVSQPPPPITSSTIGAKRERSESPVKKNAAFAKWEQREQAEQQQDQQQTPRGHRRAKTMDATPKKVHDDEWRSGIGRSDSRAALRPVASNVLPDAAPDTPPTLAPTSPSRKENDDTPRHRPPSADLMTPPKLSSHSRGKSMDTGIPFTSEMSPTSPPNRLSLASRNSLATLSRSDSTRAGTRPSRPQGHVRFGSTEATPAAPHLDGEDLVQLQKSATPQFRQLSKMATSEEDEDFGIHSPQEQVAGLAGRRRLQRSGSVKPNTKDQSSFSSQYASTRWMDTKRKHLQAYEYLCHIGEARAWLEDVLDPAELPPIVQLEESLRDGVTLAETVVRLSPSLPTDQQRSIGSQRIFRSPRLQFRHSDNIALFFRFLAQIELPELFRFELVDLYEKKNIPKVIYCIHALSWLLFRKNIVDFRIGNLVGQLEFEEHELEETQKGIDRSGVQMPNFGGMREAMQVEPEPEPEPTPDELLAEQTDVIADMQAQIRGALTRLKLGGLMQEMWDAEPYIAQFQALARGGFAREIFDFKLAMDSSTRRFQATAKAVLVRRQLHRKQQAWRENGQDVVKVQSLWRGRQERAQTKQIRSHLQRQRHGVRDLQAAIRGALGRWKAGDLWHETREAGSEIEGFQTQARAALARIRVSAIMNELWDVEDSISALQAIARGSKVRQTAEVQKKATQQATVDVARLQAAARAMIQRKEQKTQHGQFKMEESGVAEVQSAARGLLARLQQARTAGALQGREDNIVKLQAALRAHGKRKIVEAQQASAQETAPNATKLQAFARGQKARHTINDLREQLQQHNEEATSLQSFCRAMLQRRAIGTQLGALEDHEPQITALQSFSRAYLERQRVFDLLVAMEKEEESISQLQAFCRAMLTRSHVGTTLGELEEHEESIVELQSACRAFVVRRNFEQKRTHYRENMQKVVKLQSFVRAKQQGESYKSLVNGKNPPLPVVRRHLHLLTDSTLEFEGELEAERLRRQVVESVRRNELVEGYVEGLDVKIALLVKNKITLDEVVKHQKHFGGSASQLLRNGSSLQQSGSQSVDLKALNKSSRKKLSGYEELFFLLQTQPQYLARLFQQVTAKGLTEKDAKSLERLMMTLFGYAQKSREEYLLLKLFACSSRRVVEQCQGLDDVVRGQNAAFQHRVLLSYIRSPKDRGYLKSLLGSMIKNGICGQEHLDLESDPLQIYRALINNEELSTGRPSQRPRDLPREVVIREADVRPQYVEHLQDLRDLCDGFFQNLEETLHRMPYGIRYVAAEQHRALCERFPHEDPAQFAMIAGAWLWKTYLLPALKEPEMWGVVDRGLSPMHRRNLAQVTTVVGQVVAGRLFGAENLYLQPLNNWVSESLERWSECLHNLLDLPSPEEWFDADQFSDLYARTRPTVYIKLADIFALHGLVAENAGAVAPTRDDQIKELLSDLGTVKANESDLCSAAPQNGGEISLTLRSRFNVQEDPDAEARALFTATKRLVLYVIKVQNGGNLMEILLRPISHEDADRWIAVVAEEVAEKDRAAPKRHSSLAFDPRASLRGARAHSVYSEAPSMAPSSSHGNHHDLLDLQSTTYAELKSNTLENILQLENPATPPHFRVSRHNAYQDLLNALASDIRQKHRRRLERAREVDATRATLSQLDAKAAYLEDQLKSYNDYIEQCLHTLAHKKNSAKGHKFVLPFTKQWSHERELTRAGRQPKFGSYKYSARQLADKGVLLSWAGFAAEHWGQLDVVISSDEVGIFHLEASSGSMMLPGASANVLLDELLQAQYDNRGSVGVFDGEGGQGGAKLAVNLLLHLVFKKFYRDE